MAGTLKNVLENTLDRLYKIVTGYLPSLLAAAIVLLAAYLMALAARWVLNRIFKGPAIDRFLRQSGLAFVIDPSGRLRATRLVAETAYWCFLVCGILLGLSVFDTNLTTQMIEGFVLLLPKLVLAGLIVLGGAWLGQYLGRSMLVCRPVNAVVSRMSSAVLLTSICLYLSSARLSRVAMNLVPM